MTDGLQMKYFVLKPKGDDVFAAASRKAMRAYARHIMEENQQFAQEVLDWADHESDNALFADFDDFEEWEALDPD